MSHICGREYCWGRICRRLSDHAHLSAFLLSKRARLYATLCRNAHAAACGAALRYASCGEAVSRSPVVGSALIGVEKNLILNKLSHAEIAEDIFAFRKTKVLNYVEEKGITYFSRRNPRGTSELKSLADLEFVDQRTLFEAISAFDTYDLAKLLSAVTGEPICDRLFSVMTEARKKEVSWVMRREIKIDPLEIAEIEERFIETVRAIKSSATAAAPLSNVDARHPVVGPQAAFRSSPMTRAAVREDAWIF